MKKIALESCWILVGQIATTLGSLILVRVLTENLSPTQYGELALGLTIAGLANQIVTGGISNGIGRFYAIATEKNEIYQYLKAAKNLITYATLATGFLTALLILGLIYTKKTQWVSLFVVAMLYSIFTGINTCVSSIQNSARRRSIVVTHNVLDAWLKIGLSLLILPLLGISSENTLIIYAVSALLITGSQIIFLLKCFDGKNYKTNPKLYKIWEMKIWSFSWPYSAWGIFTWAQLSSDRWSLQAYSTLEEVGKYSLAYQLGYGPIAILTGMVTSIIGPIMYQRSGDATDKNRILDVHILAWRLTIASLAITAISFIITLHWHQSIFQLLSAKNYQEGSYLLPWMVLSGGVFAAGQLLSVKLASEMKPKSMMKIKIITATLAVAMNTYGAAYFGVNGVIAGLVAFSSTYFLWMAWVSKY